MTATIVLIVIACTLAALGKRLPRIRTLGLDTVILIFVPSYLVYIQWIPPATVTKARVSFEATDAIELFIAIVIVGGILSIERQVLVAGLVRIVLPLCAGSIAAALVGTLVGTAMGLTPFHALFEVVVPIMGGGVTAGALPLSIGYANALGTAQGGTLALMLPAVILGNLSAIVFAGLMSTFEKRRGKKQSALFQDTTPPIVCAAAVLTVPLNGEERISGIWTIGAGAAIIIMIYLFGFVASRSLGLPAPLIVLTVATVLQLANLLPSQHRSSVLVVYRFCIAVFTYPMLFAVGLLLTPWGRLIEGFALVNLVTILAVVGTLLITGYLASRWVGLHPVDGAIVTITRAAMGGTGDIAVLSAAHRFELMPFAQIATRIGGAVTVAAALIFVRHLSR